MVNSLQQHKGMVNIINDTVRARNDNDAVEAHSCVDIVTKFTDEQYTHNYV